MHATARLAAAALTLAPLGPCAVFATAAPSAAASCTAGGAATTRHAICGNPAALRIDAQMTAAFDKLVGASSPADAAVFRDSQKYWLEDRDTDCDTADDSEKPAKPAAIAACATKENMERYRFLAGLPDEGPGASDPIVPVMREGQGFIWSFHFAAPSTPAEKLLNDRIDAEVAALHIGKIDDDSDYTDIFDAELKYASPDFLSASVFGEHTANGGKPAEDIAYNLNIDMQTGKLLAFADAFPAGALPKLQALCGAELKDYLTPTADETAAESATDLATLDGKVADLGQWSFGATRATISMDPGDEDPYECHFAYRDLRPLIATGFPLPPG